MEYATDYDVGDRKRGAGINEDSVAISVFEQGHREGRDGEGLNRNAAAFALADGAGGHDAGDVASYIATTVVCERLSSVAVAGARADPGAFDVDVDDELLPDAKDAAAYREAIEDAVVAAHREVLAYGEGSNTTPMTTVVAGICVDGQCHVGWVGDSRAYLVNAAHGRIEQLTKDHAVVETLRERGEIDDVAAAVHPRGNEITRALGGASVANPDHADLEVATRTVPLYAEDVLLVTSDGLVDAQTEARALYDRYQRADGAEDAAEAVLDAIVTDDEIRDAVLGADSLGDAADDLITLANDRGGYDNLSTILVRDRSLPTTPEDPPVRDVDPVRNRDTVILSEE